MTSASQHFAAVRAASRYALLAGCAAAALMSQPSQAAITLGNVPLFLIGGKPSVLVTLDNSNSMDEAPNGSAVGSNSAQSKSEIARGVVRTLTDNYKTRVNLGLMAYRQNTLSDYYIHNSPYDVSYNPANYNAAFTGARSSTTKKYRITNPADPTRFIYYNVALPFYASSSQSNTFCYSTTADASNDFKNGESPTSGPWDVYRCFGSKTGTSDAIPTWNNSASESAAGYTSYAWQSQLNPTDSDFAQGILDFGKRIMWMPVGRTWFSNGAPGRGYLHVPLKSLDDTQATAIRTKLACNVPGNPTGCTADGIKNGGQTPIEGTLLTAKDYYGGGWNVSNEGYTASCYPLPESCGKNYVILLTDGLPSTDKNGGTLSDAASALTAAAAAAANLRAAGIVTYVIGFALPYGTNPNSLDVIAAAGGTTTAYNAADSASLDAAFKRIFDDIFRRSASFGAMAQNSSSITTDSSIFQATFNSSDWSGKLIAMRPQQSGDPVLRWTTDDDGIFAAPADRKIYTTKPGAGGVELKLLANLSAAQQTALKTTACSATLTGDTCAQARIDWLRGDRSKEGSAGSLRARSKLLGDIIDSSPAYMPQANAIFVGSNDGMLHAFDAGSGRELFAYMPSDALTRAYKLTSPNYSHEYFVDGDITISNPAISAGRSILVGALGRGGRGLFALNVSSPSSFGASDVLWEFSDADLGNVLGKPFIAKLNNGVTAVVVGNGPNSATDRAFLFVINAATGALIRKIDTGAGSSTASNGLSSPNGSDLDGNGTIDVVYAGDLLGNVWKFDLSSGSAASWGSAFASGGSPAPLFVAKDASNNRQPITAMIELGLNARSGDANFGKRFLFFGTGRYLTTSDVSSNAVQSWYGLIDGATTISGRSALRQRTIALQETVAGKTARGFSLAAGNDMSGQRGWYIDFTTVGGAATGERVISASKYYGNALMVSSIVPSTNQCVPGGSGFLNAIDPFTGGALDSPFFDANGDGLFNNSDRIGSGAAGTSNARRAIGSIDQGIGLLGEGALIGKKVFSGGTGTAGDNDAATPCSSGDTHCRPLGVDPKLRTGRIAWRELVRD